ncbi:MAG: PDDEXK nuclease domain-containing protein [Lentisphaeria bacterium]|nr:PDDEXK nuclease domain-containing protein [Lentisphaeria bacterium]
MDKLYRSVRKIIEQARGFVSVAANTAIVRQNWEIGRLIVEDEQGGKRKAEYGKAQLAGLANRLTTEYGKGYDASNLRYMRQFYLAFPICDALRHELSWTHYRTLMRVTDDKAREWYVNECVACGWGTRELDRQVSTQAYERLLSSTNPDRRRKRQAVPNTPLPDKPKSLVPADFIKNPMILEFLSLPDDIKLRETQLESAIISHLKEVLMELGRGFCFVARQKHMRSGSDDYFIDLVFYNCILKCYVLFDLKIGKVTHKDVGQMDMYRRMFDELICQPDDKPTIGIVLCDETDPDIARYSVLSGNDKLYAVKYTTVMPSEDVLRHEIAAQKELFLLQMQDTEMAKKLIIEL